MAANRGDKAATLPPKSGSRRRFLGRLWWILGGLAVVELVWVLVSFIRPRPRRVLERDDGGVVLAGPAERFAKGSVTAFPQGKFYLVRLEDGGFLALHRRCTHLGCTVPWVEEERHFACPCHASTFTMTGEVVAPPAPRPLDVFAVRIENGIVKVEAGRARRRSAFRRDQVVYPG